MLLNWHSELKLRDCSTPIVIILDKPKIRTCEQSTDIYYFVIEPIQVQLSTGTASPVVVTLAYVCVRASVTAIITILLGMPGKIQTGICMT